jgi:hypothetical protein
MINNNELAIQRTKLANQRTYLSYVRTGFAIASIAGTFKKLWIVAFGLLMILGSSIQYYFAIRLLNNKEISNNKVFDYIPLIYVPLLLIVLYLQFNK